MQNIIYTLMQNFESFNHKPDESLESIYRRFGKLILELKTVNEHYSQSQINDKFFRSLPDRYYSKQLQMQSDKNWQYVPLEELYGELRIHEVRFKYSDRDEKIARKEKR